MRQRGRIVVRSGRYLAACVLLGSLLACGGGESNGRAEAAPGSPSVGAAPPSVDATVPLVEVVAARNGTVDQHVRLAGSLEAFERVALHARVTGYLEELRVDIGSRVAEGEVLARLAIPEMEAELSRTRAEIPAARARLDRARANAELAEVTARRLQELQSSEPGAVMAQDVDIAEAEKKVAQSEVAVLQADLKRARAHLAELEAMARYAEIRAPFAGVITERHVHPGALVIAGDQSNAAPILSIARTDRLRLAVPVPESLARACQSGLELAFEIDTFPGRAFRARVSRVASALDPQTRMMRTEADVENEDGALSPGMYARVELDLGGLPKATALPASTVRGGTSAPHVFAVEDGRLRRVAVEVLKDDGATIVVSSDLTANTPVVVASAARLEEGQRVRIHESADQP